MSERLQKILARAGYGSRRAAETLITSGRVSVNARPVTALGTRADAAVDAIAVDGVVLAQATEQVYLAMHKPAEYVTTVTDTHGRRTVMELLPGDLPTHVLPIGRLDRDTEGLLLFTNDGELAHRVTHPRYRVDKEYHALVEGYPDETALAALRRGVEVGGRMTARAQVEIAAPPAGYERRDGDTWLRIVIHEGRKRQVRLMCATVGHPVRRLVRTRVGNIALGRLARGQTRRLRAGEVTALRVLVGLA